MDSRLRGNDGRGKWERGRRKWERGRRKWIPAYAGITEGKINWIPIFIGMVWGEKGQRILRYPFASLKGFGSE
jgi:hypothetical protein